MRKGRIREVLNCAGREKDLRKQGSGGQIDRLLSVSAHYCRGGLPGEGIGNRAREGLMRPQGYLRPNVQLAIGIQGGYVFILGNNRQRTLGQVSHKQQAISPGLQPVEAHFLFCGHGVPVLLGTQCNPSPVLIHRQGLIHHISPQQSGDNWHIKRAFYPILSG
jgi:hypothetical protein